MHAIFGFVTLMLLTPAAPPHTAAGDEMFRVVSPEYVAEHGQDANVKVLDVRTSVSDYQHGHVPGAVFIANDVFRAPESGVPVQYLGPDAIATLFQRVGVNRGDEVIVYADADDVWARRWWPTHCTASVTATRRSWTAGSRRTEAGSP